MKKFGFGQCGSARLSLAQLRCDQELQERSGAKIDIDRQPDRCLAPELRPVAILLTVRPCTELACLQPSCSVCPSIETLRTCQQVRFGGFPDNVQLAKTLVTEVLEGDCDMCGWGVAAVVCELQRALQAVTGPNWQKLQPPWRHCLRCLVLYSTLHALHAFFVVSWCQIPPSVTGRLIGPGGRQINEIQDGDARCNVHRNAMQLVPTFPQERSGAKIDLDKARRDCSALGTFSTLGPS